MKTLKAATSSDKFVENFINLKKHISEPQPTDSIQLQCANCKLTIQVDGFFEIHDVLHTEIYRVIDGIIRKSISKHYNANEKCVSSSVFIHPLIGTPQRFIFKFKDSPINLLNQDFNFAGDYYEASIQVLSKDSNMNAIFAIYEKSNERKFSKIIMENLNNLGLNLEVSAEKLEIWQLPIVNTVANVMISQQEQETLLAENMKCLENSILRDLTLEENMSINLEVYENGDVNQANLEVTYKNVNHV